MVPDIKEVYTLKQNVDRIKKEIDKLSSFGKLISNNSKEFNFQNITITASSQYATFSESSKSINEELRYYVSSSAEEELLRGNEDDKNKISITINAHMTLLLVHKLIEYKREKIKELESSIKEKIKLMSEYDKFE